jgi:alkylated DNA repair dioxygenase AlkB
MRPIYLPDYILDKEAAFNHLLTLKWLEVTTARKEYFMSNQPLSYTYGSGQAARTYTSEVFSEPMQTIMDKLNEDYHCNYNICFLNRYDNSKNQLGWHADNSPEMNTNHDICVISFGSEREIWWKKQDYKGEIPKENRQLLHNGSLFIMPAHFQETNFHKIPKCDKECGIRISLTFRNYQAVEKIT